MSEDPATLGCGQEHIRYSKYNKTTASILVDLHL